MKQTAKEFMSSINVDNMLYDEEIAASMAHARMLKQNKLISDEECDQIIEGLKQVLADIEAGKVEFKVEYDDIHGCIEQQLEEKIGRVARKLNWSRSVNDQVVIDTRLFLRHALPAFIPRLRDHHGSEPDGTGIRHPRGHRRSIQRQALEGIRRS